MSLASHQKPYESSLCSGGDEIVVSWSVITGPWIVVIISQNPDNYGYLVNTHSQTSYLAFFFSNQSQVVLGPLFSSDARLTTGTTNSVNTDRDLSGNRRWMYTDYIYVIIYRIIEYTISSSVCI